MKYLKLTKIVYLIAFLVVAGNLKITNGAKILGVFTSISPSHLIVYMSMMKPLAEAGHNITLVFNQKPKVTHPAIKLVIIPPTEEQQKALDSTMNEVTSKKKNFVETLFQVLTSMNSMITSQLDMLKDERFTALYAEKFDLLYIGYFLNDYQLGLAAKFKAPVIVVWTGPPGAFTNDLVGNPLEVAYVPSPNVALEHGEHMNFVKRLQNFASAGAAVVFKLMLDYKTKNYYDELFGQEKNFPTLAEMKRNVSLVFCNSHFSEGPIRPNVPAVVEIGGIQIKEKPDPLPKDIAEFLNTSAENGVILFCLGSNVKGSNINSEINQIIFKTLSSLKQKVIWKWDDLNNLPGKSANILYKQWIPQDDILAHPNLKLFITHAGKGGIAEAQYHAVPMVALPVFADQPGNAEKMQLLGYGVHLDIFSMTPDSFRSAIQEVIENPKYKTNIKHFSDLYRDRPLTAKQSVVYWTEYVLRHHGAKHMQSPLVYLNFFQSTSLDVIIVLLLIAYIVCKIIKFVFIFIKNKLTSKCNRNKKDYKKLKNN